MVKNVERLVESEIQLMVKSFEADHIWKPSIHILRIGTVSLKFLFT